MDTVPLESPKGFFGFKLYIELLRQEFRRRAGYEAFQDRPRGYRSILIITRVTMSFLPK
jgi:hypothetical protein